jgi:predicted amidophosphoribosyltransferase
MDAMQDRRYRIDALKQGRMICAWCGRDLGPSGARADSHGICAECERKLRQQAGLKEAR